MNPDKITHNGKVYKYNSRLKKYALGGDEDKTAVYAQAAGYAGSLLQNLAPNSTIGTVGGGVLQGVGTGASIGSAIPGIGTAAGAAVGGLVGLVGGLFGNSERQRQIAMQREQERRAKAAKQLAYDTEALAMNQPNRIQGYYAYGGAMPVGQGSSTTLASDVQLFEGPKHSGGGIPVDTDQDGLPNAEVEGGEVQKGTQVYSDRLKPSSEMLAIIKQNKVKLPKGATYAKIAEILGTKKGKFENKLQSHSSTELATGKAMTERYDNLMEQTFLDQEVKKETENGQVMAYGGKYKKYADGGDIDPVKERNDLEAKIRALRTQLDDPRNGGRRGDLISQMNQLTSKLNKVSNAAYLSDRTARLAASNPTPTDAQVREANSYYIDRNLRARGFGSGIGNYSYDTGKTYIQNLDAARKASRSMEGDAPFNPVTGGEIPATQSVSPVQTTSVPRLTNSTGRTRRASYTSGRPNTLALPPASGNLPSAASASGSVPAPITSLQGRTPATVTGATPPPVSTPQGTEGTFFDNYGADILNLASFVGNNARINQMRAPQASFVSAPQYNYNDRSYVARNDVRLNVEAARRNLVNTSSQGRSAENAALLAEGIRGTNQVNNAENYRRDAYNNDYTGRIQQVNVMNNQIANQNADVQAQVANEKIGMRIGSQNAFLQGVIGNQAVRNQEELDRERMGVILAQLPDPEKGEAYINQYKYRYKRRR